MKDIKLVYQNKWIIERIYYESSKLSSKITNTTIFEERAVGDVAQYLVINKEHIKNKRHIMYLIKRRVWEAEDRDRKEDYTTFSSLSTNDEEEDEIEFDPEDVLADVESDLINKETIELLAENDRRRKKVLESWSLGNTNDALMSRSLARSLGGNERSHRIFIQRFRKSCSERLSAAI